MQFQLTLLGTSSAIPTPRRFTAAQVLEVQGNVYLIDCGEGTQIRMQEHGVRKSKINQVFISHLHGDHINGLIGFITSFGLSGRTEAMDIFSPPGLEKYFNAYNALTNNVLPFEVRFHEIDTEKHQLIFEDALLEVYSIPLFHRVPTSGFLFKEKQRPRSIQGEKIGAYNIPYQDIPAIKQGQDWITPEGERIPNKALTKAPPPPRSYAYCSDTSYTKSIVPIVQDVDLLYHEATYCEDGATLAKERGHATAKEAAMIAKLAGAKQLILGHYSSRYKSTAQFEQEAKAIFPNTAAGEDGMQFEVPFEK
jgi:ribonuclease Z